MTIVKNSWTEKNRIYIIESSILYLGPFLQIINVDRLIILISN